MHFLIKEVVGPTAKPSGDGECGADCEGNTVVDFCCKYFDVSTMNTIRVWYCWILVHAILITIAANTYEWSWGTGNLRELANTAMFFLTSIVYLLMIAAMIVCYSCRRVSEQSAPRSDLEQTVTRIKQKKKTVSKKTTVRTSTQNSSSTVIRVEKKESIVTTRVDEKNTEQPNNKEQPFASMLTIGLILSNFLCMAATLVVFFHPKPGSSDRTVGLIIVLVHVIITSTIWMILLICLHLLTNRTSTSTSSTKLCKVRYAILCYNFCFWNCIFPPIIVVITHVSLWLLVFLLPLLICIILVICVIVCIIIVQKEWQARMLAVNRPMFLGIYYKILSVLFCSYMYCTVVLFSYQNI